MLRARQTFFDTSFQLLGRLAKADGRVSEAEIAQAESLMRQLGIRGPQREEAISRFRQGAAEDFDLDLAITVFRKDCAGPRLISQTLLSLLISMAMADGRVTQEERLLLQPDRGQLSDAYRALGVAPDCSDRELKRAYRKLMSEHHPDKLVARGVPESMMKVATEKAQEIQAAYELVRKTRQST